MKEKYRFPAFLIAGAILSGLFITHPCSAQISKDTLRVMTYNVLGFGTANPSINCQAPAQSDLPPLYADLKAILGFANADLIGLDKMQCVQTTITDPNGISGVYFPDTVIAECMNSNYPGRYAFCPFTDNSDCSDGTSDLLFYDQTKLVYVSTTPMYTGEEDFDMYKFYYNTYLNNSEDTTYLYVITCHTRDNGDVDPTNNYQDSIVMNKVRSMFTHTPNLIYMGDFNTKASTESGYEYITQTSDTNYIMDDPPFHPDNHLGYPDDWNSGNTDQAYFTTTTRVTTIPNSCGTTGGAKDWYDHIFLSPWIVNGVDNIQYVKDSYKTIGNNGNRAGIDVNDSTTHGFNTSAPDNVIDALFHFSDKYPVEVTLAVSPVLAVKNIQSSPGSIKINNPVDNEFVIHFAPFLEGQDITMEVYDVCGRNLDKTTFNVSSSTMYSNTSLIPGVYFIRFTCGGYSTVVKVVKD